MAQLPPDELTKREWEVIELIAHGLTDAQIARRLSLGWRTVQFYNDNIRMKLAAPNRSFLIIWWYENVEIPKRLKGKIA